MSGYTDHEIALIGRWLREGLSATGIAGRLSVARGREVSRNAIIGIVLRNKVLNGIGFARGPRARKAGIRVPAPNVRRTALARASQSRAKASEDNGRISATSCAPVTGEASRAHGPDRAGGTTPPISRDGVERHAPISPERATAQRENVPSQHEFRPGSTSPGNEQECDTLGVTTGETVSFLDAMNRGLCLFFADEPMDPAGPDMPVCGAPRQIWSRKPYCEACLRREAPAEGRKPDRASAAVGRPAGGPASLANGAVREAVR